MPHYRVTLRHLHSRCEAEVHLDAPTWVEAFRRALDSRMEPHWWEVIEVAGGETPTSPPQRGRSQS